MCQEINDFRSRLTEVGPCERFNGACDTHGYSHFIVIGGVYKLDPNLFDICAPESFIPAVRHCLDKHPFLNVFVQKGETQPLVYSLALELDLRRHIHLSHEDQEHSESDLEFAERIVQPIMNTKVPRNMPPWMLVVVPGLLDRRCLVFFAYSHSIGDGLAGAAFHKTFLEALQIEGPTVASPGSLFYRPSVHTTLPPAFDTSTNHPTTVCSITKSAISKLTHKCVCSNSGAQPVSQMISPTTWTGARPLVYERKNQLTEVKLIRIELKLLLKAIRACKAQRTIFTGFIEQVLAEVVEKALIATKRYHNRNNEEFNRFVSCTAVNMRHLVGVPNDTMSMYASAFYGVHHRTGAEDWTEYPAKSHQSCRLSARAWNRARFRTQGLAVAASQVNNQRIARCRHISSPESHLKCKSPISRTVSWELSNIGQVDTAATYPSSTQELCATLEELMFMKPVNATGGPLCVNVVTLKGRSCVISLTWQKGAIFGRDAMKDEVKWVEILSGLIKTFFVELDSGH